MNHTLQLKHSLIHERQTVGDFFGELGWQEEESQSPAERAFVAPLFHACARLIGVVWSVHVWQQLPMKGRRPDWFLSIVPWHLYLPERNHRKIRVAIEIDGKKYHSDENTFQRDREKDRIAARAGIITLRYAAAEVFNGHVTIAADLTAIVEQKSRAVA